MQRGKASKKPTADLTPFWHLSDTFPFPDTFPQGAQYSFHWGQGGTDMKTIDLEKEKMDLAEVIKIARREPVLLVTPDGKEFCIAEADDFEKEVEALRGSRAFQRFLDERSASARRIPLEDIEAEIEKELAKQEKTA
jgi:hypothetical protein